MRHWHIRWQLALALGWLLGCETTAQVGSTCRGGLCPDRERPLGDACSLGNLRVLATHGPGASASLEPLCIQRRLPDEPDGLVPCQLRVRYARRTTTLAECQRVQGMVSIEAASGEPYCALVQLSEAQGLSPGASGWYYEAAPAGEACASAIVLTHGLLADEEALIEVQCSYSLVGSTETFVVPPEACTVRDQGPVVSDVGAACLPDGHPPDGYLAEEVFLETASSQCLSGVCLVAGLSGVLGDPCQEARCAAGSRDCVSRSCPSPEEIARRVHCSCRCAAGTALNGTLCVCPEGYVCQELVRDGPAAGGYCVRESALNRPAADPAGPPGALE